MSKTLRVVPGPDGPQIIETESNIAPCTQCGAVDELRPYGPNGTEICFTCGMADEPATRAEFYRQLGYEEVDHGEDGVEIIDLAPEGGEPE